MIDTAVVYQNETEIGNAIRDFVTSGKGKREDIFVTTKLWCAMDDPVVVEEELRGSLTRLQLEYVDLYLVHQPVSFSVGSF